MSGGHPKFDNAHQCFQLLESMRAQHHQGHADNNLANFCCYKHFLFIVIFTLESSD